MSILRTIVFMVYLFGYLVVHLSILRRGEKALKRGDWAEVDAVTREYVPHWCGTLLRIARVKISVTGQENLPEGRACVFVANHRSYFDIPIMLTALDAPHGLLAKKEIDRLPLVRRWMRLLGCVFVDRKDVHASMKALSDATATVEAGRSFTIFPEGTRYKGEEGGMGECKGGAFRIATKCGAPLVPVAITGTRGIFEAHHNLVHPGTVCVHILPPVETAGLSRADQKTLPDTVRAAILQQLASMTAQ